MQLRNLTYSHYEGDSREWKLNNLVLSNTNLIVGKNATGKSKSLNVISVLSMLLSAVMKLPFDNGNYDVTFDEKGTSFHYELRFRDKKIYHEIFQVDGKELLTRGEGGVGLIFAEKEDKKIQFQTPQDELAVVARRDSLQHSYLEPLYEWAKGVLTYHFSSSLGKESMLVVAPTPSLTMPPMNIKDENAVVGIYWHGYNEYKDVFDSAIRNDMASIGYEIEDVRSGALQSISLQMSAQTGAVPIGMGVKEKDLPSYTEHFDMSTGMFRALSLFIQLNYAIMAKIPTCILIDDIGEGLDYERSCSIIQRLMAKSTEASVQLIMSSNDRFVMNSVPLEFWSVLQRNGGQVHVFNYENSRRIFDDFKFSGLNNFDFFAYDYLNESGGEGETDAEACNLR